MCIAKHSVLMCNTNPLSSSNIIMCGIHNTHTVTEIYINWICRLCTLIFGLRYVLSFSIYIYVVEYLFHCVCAMCVCVLCCVYGEDFHPKWKWIQCLLFRLFIATENMTTIRLLCIMCAHQFDKLWFIKWTGNANVRRRNSLTMTHSIIRTGRTNMYCQCTVEQNQFLPFWDVVVWEGKKKLNYTDLSTTECENWKLKLNELYENAWLLNTFTYIHKYCLLFVIIGWCTGYRSIIRRCNVLYLWWYRFVWAYYIRHAP